MIDPTEEDKEQIDETSVNEVGQYLQNSKDSLLKAKDKCSNMSRWEKHKFMSKFALERKNYDSYIEIDSAHDTAMLLESTNYLDDID